MVAIGIDQSLNNSAMYKNECLVNINKLYTSTRKYNDQQHYKAIIEAKMVLTPEIFTDNSPMSTGPYETIKKFQYKKTTPSIYWSL